MHQIDPIGVLLHDGNSSFDITLIEVAENGMHCSVEQEVVPLRDCVLQPGLE